MNKPAQHVRNELTVAIRTVRALIDGKLEPTQQHFAAVLESLQALDASSSRLRHGAVAEDAPGEESLVNAIIEGSPYANILVDDRGRIALVNAPAEKLFGYTRDEMLGESIEILVPERFKHRHPEFRASFNEAPAARPMGAGRDLYGRRKDGSEVPIEIGLNPITTDAGTFTLAAMNDITERKRVEELRLLNAAAQRRSAELEELNREIAESATRDGLTGVLGRRAFDEVLEREWNRSRRAETPLALLFIDIDHFKTINDELGHPAGDTALKVIAETIDIQARRAGETVARYGGDEFVLILPSTNLEGALVSAERVRASVAELHLKIEERSVTLTVSVGVAAQIPRLRSKPQELIELADRAVYEAKNTGRNVCVGAAMEAGAIVYHYGERRVMARVQRV